MADVQDVANRIIDYHIDAGCPITNLKLQSYLFFAQCEHISRSNGELLFEDDIVAGHYAPMVYPVYDRFRIWAAMPLDEYQEETERGLSPAERASINICCTRWHDIPAWNFNAVALNAWPYAQAKEDKGGVIPIEDIFAYACEGYRRGSPSLDAGNDIIF